MNAATRSLLAAVVVFASASMGCDEATPSTNAASLPAPTFGEARVRGTVRFVGTPPSLPMIDTGGTCRGGRAIQAETIVVDRAGGLRDVVVWLADAPPSNGATLPPPLLDQVGCQYQPHVVAVQANQPLKIRSSDPEFHNVHWNAGENPGENFGYSTPGETRTVTLRSPEFVRLRCDVHPWMEAYVAVLPNPFSATTAADGTFSIERVPAGTYRAKAWHALLGERSATVTVTAGGQATLDIEYAKPS